MKMAILKIIMKTSKHIPLENISEFKGKDLEGMKYEQLLPYEANTLEKIRK